MAIDIQLPSAFIGLPEGTAESCNNRPRFFIFRKGLELRRQLFKTENTEERLIIYLPASSFFSKFKIYITKIPDLRPKGVILNKNGIKLFTDKNISSPTVAEIRNRLANQT